MRLDLEQNAAFSDGNYVVSIRKLVNPTNRVTGDNDSATQQSSSITIKTGNGKTLTDLPVSLWYESWVCRYSIPAFSSAFTESLYDAKINTPQVIIKNGTISFPPRSSRLWYR